MRQQNREEAVRTANKVAAQIEKLADMLKAKAEELRVDASWPAVGSLQHVRGKMLEVAAGFHPTAMTSETEEETMLNVLRDLGFDSF